MSVDTHDTHGRQQSTGADGAASSAPAGASAMQMVYREHELDLRVARREAVADDVVALTLESPDGTPLPAWTPGAHVDLVLDDGLVRQYSLCGVRPEDDATWRIGVLRTPDSRGGSRAVHDTLHEGSVVRTRGPRNHFLLVDAPRYLFVAGGIGITPLLPMIASAHRRGIPWELVYGGRQRSSMAFVEELASYGDHVRLWPQDEKGMLDLAGLLGEPRPDTLIYCCGPEGLLSAVEGQCARWPAGSLHLERFSARALDPATTVDTQFELVLQRSGITTTVPPGRTILEVVEEAGLSVLSSCRIGTCGTCEQGVISGELDHRDAVLTEEDRETGEYLLICVSRACSDRLVLDL